MYSTLSMSIPQNVGSWPQGKYSWRSKNPLCSLNLNPKIFFLRFSPALVPPSVPVQCLDSSQCDLVIDQCFSFQPDLIRISWISKVSSARSPESMYRWSESRNERASITENRLRKAPRAENTVFKSSTDHSSDSTPARKLALEPKAVARMADPLWRLEV